ncbi:hypothetical protein F5887DRAFT_984264 [Amanita rubescens]|nr:hypothetical protein F5887DRAFT_984264 [Amanita rubescens]
MSLLGFDDDAQQFRVFISPVKKLPPNPHIGPGSDAILRALAPPSETTRSDSEWSPESPEDKSLRHRLLACDQRSFFTGSASADLQAAHIINPVRRDPERKRLVVKDLLSRQKLQDPSVYKFLLDSPTNAILLEASLHVHWDIYGTFCIVPSDSDASAMLEALRKINEDWAKHDSSEGHVRPLDISQPPFAKPHWEIVVLHPHALLPDGQPLVIAQDRTLYRRGETAQPTSSITWTYWIAVEDHLCSASPPHAPLDPFIVPNLRSASDKPLLSSLAMVVNAHYKLAQFMRDHGSSASPRVQRFAQQMSDLVTAIFFAPQTHTGVAVHRHSVSQQGHHMTAQSSSVAHRFSSLGQSSPSGTMEDSSEPPGEDLDAVEPPETPDADGLTASEFRLVAARAKDPLLHPKQRAVAAMTMMFGTRRYEDPYMAPKTTCHDASGP